MSGPRQNRVLPTGDIVARRFRGLLMGNRGILHDDEGRLGTARWRHPHWVCCRISFRGRHRQIMTPGRWTELFFLDEAVALAAGHRPCAQCRWAHFNAYRAAFGGDPRAGEIDRILHRDRVDSRSRAQIRFEAGLHTLPDGCFILHRDAPQLVLGPHLLPLADGRYGPAVPRARAHATVLTPAASVTALRNGYRPILHASALTRP